jgi:peptide/nickel transport system permease protein
MADVLVAPAEVAAPVVRTRRRRRLTGGVGWALLGLLVAMALLGPLLTPYGINEIDAASVLAGPSSEHPLGCDALGRDLLSRMVSGLRVSLMVSLGAVSLAMVLAIPIGVLAGFRGGWLDNVLMRPVDMLLAMPAMLLAVLAVAVIGPGTGVTVLAIALVYLPVLARVIRATVLSVRAEAYVDASRSRGASTFRVIRWHVLPNSLGPALVQATVLAGFAIQLEAALSFLGLGTQPPQPSLGGILADGRDFMAQAPWIEIFPGILIAISIIAFGLVGDSLRTRLDPRSAGR